MAGTNGDQRLHTTAAGKLAEQRRLTTALRLDSSIIVPLGASTSGQGPLSRYMAAYAVLHPARGDVR